MTDFPLWLSYAVLTLIASAPFYIRIRRTGGAQAAGFLGRYRKMMWAPGVMAFVYRVASIQGFRDIGYFVGPIVLLLIAVWLPLLIEILTIVLSLAARWAHLSPGFIHLSDGKARIGDRFGLLVRRRDQGLGLFGINLLISVLVGAVINIPFALAQEFGWRGYLQPLLTARFGLTLSMTLVGLIWAAWLLPLVLMGYRFPRQPRLGAYVLNPATTVAQSIVIGVLFLASGSILVPTLFQGSLMINEDLSRLGLGERGNDLRVRILGIVLWSLAAAIGVWWFR